MEKDDYFLIMYKVFEYLYAYVFRDSVLGRGPGFRKGYI